MVGLPAGVTAHVAATLLASFLASLVEFVEALTVVLAVGVTRGWRGALTGGAAAVMVLLVLVALFGPALTLIPLDWVQGVVGLMILLFGLRWLRKAVLRAAGLVPLHDETEAFAKTRAQLQGAEHSRGGSLDTVAVAAAFEIVMLEGIEVVFIVVAMGADGGLLGPAVAGALGALTLVILLGLALHRPLARVPENSLKFVVGVLLLGFGTFWVGEAIGVAWPGADASLLLLCAAYLLVALGAVRLARLTARPSPASRNSAGLAR